MPWGPNVSLVPRVQYYSCTWKRGCPKGRTVTRLVTTPWTECRSPWQGYPQQYVLVPIYTSGKVEQVSCLRIQRVGKVRTICCCWFEPVPADPKFEKQHQREAVENFLLLFSVCSWRLWWTFVSSPAAFVKAISWKQLYENSRYMSFCPRGLLLVFLTMKTNLFMLKKTERQTCTKSAGRIDHVVIAGFCGNFYDFRATKRSRVIRSWDSQWSYASCLV